MRTLLSLAAILSLGLVFVTAKDKAPAKEEKIEKKEPKKEDKELKLEGTLVCTKCKLKETEACGHALIVKEDKKEVTYYIDDKGAKEAYHKECCTKSVPAKVTGGKVVEKDSKKTIEGGKVEVKKEEKKEKAEKDSK